MRIRFMLSLLGMIFFGSFLSAGIICQPEELEVYLILYKEGEIDRYFVEAHFNATLQDCLAKDNNEQGARSLFAQKGGMCADIQRALERVKHSDEI